MPLPKLKSIIDELNSLGCIEISLGGGEPLVRPDIDEIVDYIKNKDIKVRVTTNGLLIKDKLETLKKVDTIVLSLDGDPEFNNKLKQIKGSENIINNVELLKKHKKNLRINTTITQPGIQQLDFIENLCKRFNIPLKINILYDTGFNYPDNLTITDYNSLIKRLKSMKKRINLIISNKALDKFARWSKTNPKLFKIEEIKKRKNKYCGKNLILIDVDGWVYPCCLQSPKDANCFNEPIVNCMKKVEKNNFCNDCAHFGFEDFNQTFNLDPATIIESFKNFKYY
jgi:MoaA/NifB/PqqE/SkfB family radical SAM enzyme